MRLTIFTIIALLPTCINAIDYKGIIVDDLTKQPIAYSSISALESSLGTITNEEGEFTMQSNSEQIRVICSSLGFVADTFELNSASTYHHLSLKATTIDLNTVDITTETYPRSLILKAIEKIRHSDSTEVYCNAFYRQFSKNDTIPTEFREIVFHTVSKRAFVQKVAIENGRYAMKEKGNLGFGNMFPFANLHVWGSVLYDYKNILIHTDTLRYELLGSTNSNGRKIEIVKTSPRIPRNKKYNDSVTYYIDAETFQIIECRNTSYPKNVITTGNPIADVKNEKISYQIRYDYINDTIMHPSFLSIEIDYDVRIGLVYSKNNHITSKVLFSEPTLVKPNLEFTAVDVTAKDKAIIESVAYDKSYWEKNASFQATKEEIALINSFNESNSFTSESPKKK